MAKVHVYIDGFNLYHRRLENSPQHKWLDVLALAKRLLPGDEVIAVKYFTARVRSRPSDPSAPTRQDAYLRALDAMPEVTIHYGNFMTKERDALVSRPRPGCPRKVKILRTEEKGSDVNLASHLLRDGFRGEYEAAVVLSNDSDLQTPITMVRSELRKTVGVIVPTSGAKRGALNADFYRPILGADLEATQLPNPVLDADGRAIHRPSAWSV